MVLGCLAVVKAFTGRVWSRVSCLWSADAHLAQLRRSWKFNNEVQLYCLRQRQKALLSLRSCGVLLSEEQQAELVRLAERYCALTASEPTSAQPLFTSFVEAWLPSSKKGFFELLTLGRRLCGYLVSMLPVRRTSTGTSLPMTGLYAADDVAAGSSTGRSGESAQPRQPSEAEEV